MKFFDIHAHVYPDSIAWKAAQSIRNYYHIGEEMDGTPGCCWSGVPLPAFPDI